MFLRRAIPKIHPLTKDQYQTKVISSKNSPVGGILVVMGLFMLDKLKSKSMQQDRERKNQELEEKIRLAYIRSGF